ncbi:gliding motility-associated C-terminal domain-containing protein [Marinifilum breve]|nr:gliding motility-associated C-terminal domain-containing protein [Marinifilum breve]
MKNISVVIDEGETMSFFGSFYDQTENEIVLGGMFSFCNTQPVEVLFGSQSNLETLKLSFAGENDVSLSCNNTSLSGLSLEMPSGNLFLEGEVGVQDFLTLSSGKLFVEEGGVVLLNSDVSSLVFNNLASNDSYVVGNLKRRVVAGMEYDFPVGDVDAYHPVVLTDLSDDDDVTISYSASLDDEWRGVGGSDDVTFSLDGGWIVKDNDMGSEYKIQLSRLGNDANLLDDKMAVFYTSDHLNAFETPYVDRSSLLIEPFYVMANERKGSGMYSLVRNDYGLNEEEEDLEVVNTLVADDSSPSYFKIPDLHKFKRVDIRVSDSWGRIVFTSKEYANDFDSRKYPSGTYYYHLTGYLSDGKKIVKDDIIEVIRKK